MTVSLGLRSSSFDTHKPGHEDVIKWKPFQPAALLALCEGNPPVTRVFPSQRPVTRGFDVLFEHDQTIEQTIETPVIWDAMIMTSL